MRASVDFCGERPAHRNPLTRPSRASDIALMSDDHSKLPWLVRHSRRTLAVIRQNVVFALGVKLAVFALATGGLATLWMAIAADMGASLLVIVNGLRLLRA